MPMPKEQQARTDPSLIDCTRPESIRHFVATRFSAEASASVSKVPLTSHPVTNVVFSSMRSNAVSGKIAEGSGTSIAE